MATVLQTNYNSQFAMPFFSSKFFPKKAPARRKDASLSKETIEELVSDQRTVHLKLGDHKLIFENGDWIPESGRNSATYKSSQKLKKKLEAVQEENNLLQLKLELMINMLTQATAERHHQQRENKKIRRNEETN